MNAIELLKSDHAVVADLFEQVKTTDESKHPAIFTKIKAELDVHAHIEETIFYPKLKADGKKELVDIVLEGIEEHHQIKLFLRGIASLADESEKFEPKLTVLIEDTEHHVEEEEREMFPMVEDQFDAYVLDELGAAMEAAKLVFNKEQAAAAAK